MVLLIFLPSTEEGRQADAAFRAHSVHTRHNNNHNMTAMVSYLSDI